MRNKKDPDQHRITYKPYQKQGPYALVPLVLTIRQVGTVPGETKRGRPLSVCNIPRAFAHTFHLAQLFHQVAESLL